MCREGKRGNRGDGECRDGAEGIEGGERGNMKEEDVQKREREEEGKE